MMTRSALPAPLIIIALWLTGPSVQGQNSMNIHLNSGEVVRVYLPVIDSITYSLGTPQGLPVVWTLPLDSITNNGALAGGNVVAEGASPVTERGLCWSPFAFPSIADSLLVLGAGSGAYRGRVTGMGNATYHVRAYAMNATGIQYGNDKVFKAAAGDYVAVVSLDYAKAEVPFKIAAGQQAEVNVNLNAGYLAVKAAGATAIDIKKGEKALDGSRARIGGEYAAELNKAVNAGNYHVVAYGEGNAVIAEKDVTVTAGQRTEVSLP